MPKKRQRNMVQRVKTMAFTSELIWLKLTVSSMVEMDFAMKEAMAVLLLLL